MKLVEEKKYDEAFKYLDPALEQVKSPVWLLSRAQANQQTGHLKEALRDAELAYIVAAERNQPASRSYMVDAQYRRAVAFFKLKQYANSDACSRWSLQLIEGKNFRKDEDHVSKDVDDAGHYKITLADIKMAPETAANPTWAGRPPPLPRHWSRATLWRSQALGAMEKLPEDDPGRKLTAPRIPNVSVKVGVDVAADITAENEFQKTVRQEKVVGDKGSQPSDPTSSKDTKVSQELQIDFYQSVAKVNVVLYVKGVDKSKLAIDFQRDTVSN